MPYIQSIDDAILNFIQNHINNPILDKIMPFISFTGNYGAVWIVLSILLIASKKHRNTGIAMIGSLVLCVLVGNLTLKPIIARVRPFDVRTQIELLIPGPTDFSFPSGHTMSSFAAATVLLLADKRWGIYSLILAVFIAFSRLYLFVHYPSDILGGMLIGIAIAFLSVRIVALLKPND